MFGQSVHFGTYSNNGNNFVVCFASLSIVAEKHMWRCKLPLPFDEATFSWQMKLGDNRKNNRGLVFYDMCISC